MPLRGGAACFWDCQVPSLNAGIGGYREPWPAPVLSRPRLRRCGGCEVREQGVIFKGTMSAKPSRASGMRSWSKWKIFPGGANLPGSPARLRRFLANWYPPGRPRSGYPSKLSTRRELRVDKGTGLGMSLRADTLATPMRAPLFLRVRLSEGRHR